MKNIIYFILAFTILVSAPSCSKDAGPEGPAGTRGDRGEKGDKGETGAKGIAGTDGNLLLYGNAAPAATLGKAGDFYIDKANSNLYGPKTASGWGAAVGMRGATGATGARGDKGTTGDKGATGNTGATGAAGSQFLSGTIAPAAAVGKPGDFYFNTATGQLFGPKNSNNTWAGGISLKGPKGDKGDTGAKGEKGDPGVKGADGKDGVANVKKYSFTIKASDWGNPLNHGQLNIQQSYDFANKHGILWSELNVVILAYVRPSMMHEQYKKQLPIVFGVGSGPEAYGLKFELNIDRYEIAMSKTLKGWDNIVVPEAEIPEFLDVDLIIIKGELVSALKNKLDFNDYQAVAKHFDLKD